MVLQRPSEDLAKAKLIGEKDRFSDELASELPIHPDDQTNDYF